MSFWLRSQGGETGLCQPNFLSIFSCVFFFLFLENLAFSKPTKMISTFRSYSSDRAVDGDSQTVLMLSSCIHSRVETNPWWRVDLEQVEPVNEVYIVNRGDCCGDRLNPFEIRVGKTKLSEASLKIIVKHKPRKTNRTKFSKSVENVLKKLYYIW